jgi:hypothetical protein
LNWLIGLENIHIIGNHFENRQTSHQTTTRNIISLTFTLSSHMSDYAKDFPIEIMGLLAGKKIRIESDVIQKTALSIVMAMTPTPGKDLLTCRDTAPTPSVASSFLLGAQLIAQHTVNDGNISTWVTVGSSGQRAMPRPEIAMMNLLLRPLV